MTIFYDNVIEKLFENFPELTEAYEAELRWWGNERPGPHIVYGDILNPYIDRLIRSRDDATLPRIFSFLEFLSCSADMRVQELVAFTVCEDIIFDEEKLREAKRFMGPATLRHCNDVEKFWKK